MSLKQVREFHETFGCVLNDEPTVPDPLTVKTRLALILEEFIELVDATVDVDKCSENVQDAVGEAKRLTGILYGNFDNKETHVEVRDNIDLVDVADALGDIDYVTKGTAISFGIPLDDVVDEIHRSNMSKLDANGEPIKDPSGKIKKGPNFTLPNITKILEEASE